MGRDVHITRSADWRDNDGSEISVEEWKSEMRSDPSLSPDPENGPLAVLWTEHPEGRDDAWLDWLDGNVYTTDPDDAFLEKIQALATRLNARVVGDGNQIIARVVDLG